MTLRNKDKPMERVGDIHEHCPLNRGGWETGARVPTKDIVNKVSWTKIGNGVPLSRQIHLMYFLMEGITLREIYCVTVIWIRISRGAAILCCRLHSPPLCGWADTLHRKEWHELLPLELRRTIFKSFPSWLRNVLVRNNSEICFQITQLISLQMCWLNYVYEWMGEMANFFLIGFSSYTATASCSLALFILLRAT